MRVGSLIFLRLGLEGNAWESDVRSQNVDCIGFWLQGNA